MSSNLFETVSIIGVAIEIIGVIIIVIGLLYTAINTIRNQSNIKKDALLHHFRHNIGQSLLLGLDFLVAGDIIRTVVVSNSISDVASLGLIVLIRTILVFTIHLEVHGQWPWQTIPTQNDHEDNK